jgi:lysophospholipase L1-like esterase
VTRRWLGLLCATAVACATAVTGAPSAVASAHTEHAVYLALGDSLSVGFQPDGETHQGYVDDLFRSMRKQIDGLKLRNVGCVGETSRSLITGKHSECQYAAGSQLDAAVAFLKAHRGHVAFITIDIGGNDVIELCLDPDTGAIVKACAVDLRPKLHKRVTRIVEALRDAAGPNVPVVGMTYYDPFLGYWGLVPGGRALARDSQHAWAVFDAGLEAAFRDAGVAVADVAKTFRIDDFDHTTVVPGRGRLPVNVARACEWTWFCTPESAGDPHANRTGYKKIASTFERKLKPLLS